MGQEVRDQEIRRRLAIIDKGLNSEQAGLSRVADALPGAADAFGYDIWAALEDRDDP